MLMSYQRDYYVSADRVVRATIDYDQRVYDQRQGLRPNLTWSSPLASPVILELKAPASERARLAEVAGAFPLRVERSSKYVAGVEAIHSY
jgi:hypothetical protein